MANRMSVGRCCCCVILADDFDRDDNTDLGENWTEETGDAEIATNKLKLPSGGRVISVAAQATPHQLGDGLGTIGVEITGHNAHGSKCWVIVDWVDSSNYHALEFETIDDDFFTARLRKWTAGVASTLSTLTGNPQNGGTRQVQHVCLTEFGFFAAFEDTVMQAVTSDHGGTMVGLENGTDTNVRFDDFNWQYTDEQRTGCHPCAAGCAYCTAGTAPRRYQVVIAGLVDDGCACSDYNGTYVLTHIGGSLVCNWQVSGLPVGCSADPPPAASARVLTLKVSATTERLDIAVDGTEGFNNPPDIRFSLTGLSSGRDCSTERTLTYDIGTNCDGTGATAVVTAL